MKTKKIKYSLAHKFVVCCAMMHIRLFFACIAESSRIQNMAGVFLEFSGSGAFFADLDIGTELFISERSDDEGCSGVGDLVGEFSSLYICGRSSDFHFAYLMMVAHEERKTEEILFNIRAWRSVAERRGTGISLRECLFEGCR